MPRRADLTITEHRVPGEPRHRTGQLLVLFERRGRPGQHGVAGSMGA